MFKFFPQISLSYVGEFTTLFLSSELSETWHFALQLGLTVLDPREIYKSEFTAYTF